MHFLYPCLPYYPRTVDPLWEPAYAWAKAQGLATGRVDVHNDKVWFSTSERPTQVIYRGWMPTGAEYGRLAQLVPLVVSTAEYLSSHYTTGCYEAVAQRTFLSQFLTESTPLDFTAGRRYFMKELAKSFGTGSVLAAQSQLDYCWQRQELPAGTPFFVRDFADPKPDSERCPFVVRRQAEANVIR